MRVKLQLVICNDDGQNTTVTDVVTLKKDTTRLEHLGLTLTEAKQLLKTIQKQLLASKSTDFWQPSPSVRSVAPHSRLKAIPIARSAPCLARSSCPVHDWCTALAGGARPSRSARCRPS
jgi:hypothetical protein